MLKLTKSQKDKLKSKEAVVVSEKATTNVEDDAMTEYTETSKRSRRSDRKR